MDLSIVRSPCDCETFTLLLTLLEQDWFILECASMG